MRALAIMIAVGLVGLPAACSHSPGVGHADSGQAVDAGAVDAGAVDAGAVIDGAVIDGAVTDGVVIDAAVTRAWTWHACGTLSARATPPGAGERGDQFGFYSLSMSADGTLLASNAGSAVLLWRVSSQFEASIATYLSGGAPEFPDVQVSADGRWVARMGDGFQVFNSRDASPVSRSPVPPSDFPCPWPQIRFSPDGRWLAGTDWGPFIAVRSTDQLGVEGTLDPKLELPTSDCGGGAGASVRVAFSPDGSLLGTSTLAFYRTSDWQQVPPFPADTTPQGFDPRDDVKFSPNGRELLVSRNCRGRAGAAPSDTRVCAANAYSVSDGRLVRALPELGAPFPSYSPEGQWMVAGGTLLHRPSGETRVFDPAANVALFAPNGDIVAGDPDLTFTRYCRSPL